MYMSRLPIITELNNGIIVADSAMPLKDLTSNNEAAFSMSRKLFQKSFVNDPGTLALSNKVVVSAAQKKWIGGNRDASSIIARRKISATGSNISNSSGGTSFTNIVDNNTAKDARIRVRSSGYRVPPKVTQKNVISPAIVSNVDPSTYYRIISKGWNYSGVISSAAGIYSYTIDNQVLLKSGLRSYTLMTISRSTGQTTTYTSFDVFGSTIAANNMATLLNSLDDSVIVVICTYDEPRTNSVLLRNALQRCGASSSYNTLLNYRSAYVLVGIPGMGVNNGLQKYVGTNTNISGDPNAVIDLRISVTNGAYTYISG